MSSPGRPIIMCVDDEKIILDSLEEKLDQWLGKEFQIELAESGDEALEIVQEVLKQGHLIAVVISDQIMPGMKGDQFLSELHRFSPETRKILLTGQASLEAVQNAINKAGLYRYMSKPWDPTDLMMTVQEAANSYVQKQQLEVFDESNTLLRKLNDSVRELSSETKYTAIYQKFLESAVKVSGAGRGFLLLTSDADELRLTNACALDSAENQQLETVLQTEALVVAELARILGKIRSYANNQLEPQYMALPLLGVKQQAGYVFLENHNTQEPFSESQHEILHMLVQQLSVTLEKASLFTKLEIEKAKTDRAVVLLREKNEDILDSIKYASRIQKSLVPEPDGLKELLKQSFVLTLPKDIVSGDYAWYHDRGDTVLVAAVDCTGHGVPGAMMSVITNTLLNRAATKTFLPTVADILAYIDRELGTALGQENAKPGDQMALDGMDIALLQIEKATGRMEYAGAHRPLFFARGGEVQEIMGTKYSIGGHQPEDGSPKTFEQHSAMLQPGDQLYLFSDGITDQFGGPDRRKFSRKAFRDLVQEVGTLPMNEQRTTIHQMFLDWKGQNPQTDDVVVIGVRY